MRGFLKLSVAGVVAAAVLSPGLSFAADDEASPDGKGITGGALLGAEAVMLVEAAANVKPAWAYLVGGGLGAVAGGVGGYFTEQGDTAKVPMYLLLGGMALALPTTVAVLSTTAYTPTNYTEDRPPVDEPVADPAQPTPAPVGAPTIKSPTSRARPRSGSDRAAVAARRPTMPPALLGLDGKGTVLLSIPAVEVRHVYTRTEVAQLGVKQRTEVDVPVLNVVF